MKSKVMGSTKYLMPVLIIIMIVLFVSYGLLNSRSEAIRAERRELVALSNDMLHVNDSLVKIMRQWAVCITNLKIWLILRINNRLSLNTGN